MMTTPYHAPDFDAKMREGVFDDFEVFWFTDTEPETTGWYVSDLRAEKTIGPFATSLEAWNAWQQGKTAS